MRRALAAVTGISSLASSIPDGSSWPATARRYLPDLTSSALFLPTVESLLKCRRLLINGAVVF